MIEHQGKPAIHVACADITERKRTDEALRESENRLRTLLGAVQAGVILQGKDGRIVHVNDVAARIFGMEPHAALGRTEWRRLNCRRRPLRRTQPPEGRRSRDRFYARARADENLLKRQPERSSHAGYLV